MDIESTLDECLQILTSGTPVDANAQLDPASFPGLFILPAGLSLHFVYRPLERRMPEFVYVPFQKHSGLANISKEDKIIDKWNLAWESGHLRSVLFRNHLPPSLAWLCKFQESNLYLLPDSTPKYEAYSPLYHLLPGRLIERFSLPRFFRDAWPAGLSLNDRRPLLPDDFDNLLSKAFAHHIWPLLARHSKISAFSRNDPIVILSHNLDFWLPYAYQVIENRLRGFPRRELAGPADARRLKRLRRLVPEGLDLAIDLPLEGGCIWDGEADAWQAAQELVEVADRRGKLRAVIDAVLSHRVEDDFSKRWSYDREDFERKLYHKRSKFKVAFVELDDTIPVHGPSSEVDEDLLWEDFIALLNLKERQIVVCLRNGITRAGEIGQILGYANHSPVSKALKKIRAKAQKYLET